MAYRITEKRIDRIEDEPIWLLVLTTEKSEVTGQEDGFGVEVPESLLLDEAKLTDFLKRKVAERIALLKKVKAEEDARKELAEKTGVTEMNEYLDYVEKLAITSDTVTVVEESESSEGKVEEKSAA